MNSRILLTVITFAFTVSLGAIRAGEVAPRMVDSPQAQRIRDLTLLGGARASSSPAQLAGKKVVILVELAKELNVKLKSIDARLRESNDDDEELNKLRAEREAVQRRASEVEDMLSRAIGGVGTR